MLNRAQLLDDAFDLARSGRLSYGTAMDLSRFLERETDFVVWYSFLDTLDFLENILAASEEYETFEQYILTLSQKLYEDLTAEETANDSHIKKLSRSKILPYICRYGHEECRQTALKSLRDWRENSEQIVPPNLQAAFFCAAVAEGDQTDWNFLYSKYYETPQTMSNQRSRIISGLGCSQEKTILYNYLNTAVNATSSLETKHKTSVFSAVYKSSSFGLRTAFEYVKQNYKAVNR